METIKERFSEIKDIRHQGSIAHKLCDIHIVIMYAVLCGYDQLEDIVIYGQNKIEFLKITFKVDKIPSNELCKNKLTSSGIYDIIVSELKWRCNYARNYQEACRKYVAFS